VESVHASAAARTHSPSHPPSLLSALLCAFLSVSESRRDPGIPNDWPFKAELLADIERQKAEEQASEAKRRTERKERAEQKKAKALNTEESALPASLTSSSTVTIAPIDRVAVRSRQTLRILRSVITSADLLLFVLDARDPLGSRWTQLEQRLAVTKAAPPLLFVLSHCDLVPAAAVEAWLAYLNAEVPTVAFVSDRTLDTAEGKLTVEAETRKPLRCPSVDALRQVVAGYRREAAEQKEAAGLRPAAATAPAAPVSVAVLGFENVGKSSLINFLLRRHVCGVAAQAGFTKDVRAVTMGAAAVRLLDTPGIPSLSAHPGPHITLPLDRAQETGQSSSSTAQPAAPCVLHRVPATL
jgi:nuclear GTP-binding protein